LLKREAALELVVNGAGATARRADGFLGFSISGALGSPIFLPSKEPPMGMGGNGPPMARGPSVPPPPMRFGTLPPAGATTVDVPPALPPPPPPALPTPSSGSTATVAVPDAPPPSGLPPPAQAASANAVPPPTVMRVGGPGGLGIRGALEGASAPTGPEEGSGTRPTPPPEGAGADAPIP
jgi:hypothetical protein